MKVTVNDNCCGYAECVAVAPQLFKLGDTDQATLVKESPLSGPDAELAREASYSCPVEAIEITE